MLCCHLSHDPIRKTLTQIQEKLSQETWLACPVEKVCSHCRSVSIAPCSLLIVQDFNMFKLAEFQFLRARARLSRSARSSTSEPSSGRSSSMDNPDDGVDSGPVEMTLDAFVRHPSMFDAIPSGSETVRACCLANAHVILQPASGQATPKAAPSTPRPADIAAALAPSVAESKASKPVPAQAGTAPSTPKQDAKGETAVCECRSNSRQLMARNKTPTKARPPPPHCTSTAMYIVRCFGIITFACVNAFP